VEVNGGRMTARLDIAEAELYSWLDFFFYGWIDGSLLVIGYYNNTLLDN